MPSPAQRACETFAFRALEPVAGQSHPFPTDPSPAVWPLVTYHRYTSKSKVKSLRAHRVKRVPKQDQSQQRNSVFCLQA